MKSSDKSAKKRVQKIETERIEIQLQSQTIIESKMVINR